MSDTQSKIGYGPKERVGNALESEALNKYDIIITSNEGSEEIGFVKPDGSVAFLKARPVNEVFQSYDEWKEFSSTQNTQDVYAGQTVKIKLDDGRYHTYVLQTSDSGGYELEEIGTGSVTITEF